MKVLAVAGVVVVVVVVVDTVVVVVVVVVDDVSVGKQFKVELKKVSATF